LNPLVKLQSVSKSFRSISGEESVALNEVSLGIRAGEFLAVVGPSGCGKSTLLKLISGLEAPTAGSIARPTIHRLGLVFQENTVFPWRTVERNLTYSLEVERLSRLERHNEARRLCGVVGLDPDRLLGKYPKELSGGETRRVAIGMALAYRPEILLLDEPTSQLDYFSRVRMRQIIQKIWLGGNLTVVLVTHDIDEAIILGDRVLVLSGGRILDLIEIDLQRPRKESVLSFDSFDKYRQRIAAHFSRFLDS